VNTLIDTAPEVESQILAKTLPRADRRLLLIASLTLYLRRIRHGIRVTGDDLKRLAPHADDPEGRAA
jgi:hypothetical protein